MDYIIIKDYEYEYIWRMIQNQQIIFHSRYAPEGQLDFSSFQKLKQEKELAIIIDRNFLSSLFKLCEKGKLKNDLVMRKVAILMAWSKIENVNITSGLALKERASKEINSEQAKIELQKFYDIFDYYSAMVWLRLAEGVIDEIPVIKYSDNKLKIKVKYHDEDDHLLMHMATMIQIVYLFRNTNLNAEEKVLEFLKWNTKNLLICDYTNTYIVLLFTNQGDIQAPKILIYVDSMLKITDKNNYAGKQNSYFANYYRNVFSQIFIFSNCPHIWQ